LLQIDPAKIPVVLGQTGTILLGLYSTAVTFLNVWLVWKSREAAHWKGATQALESELSITRGRSDRLTADNTKLVEENTKLKAATDLTSLAQSMNDMSERSQDKYEKVMQAINEQTRALLGFQSQNASAFEMVAESLRHVEGGLKSIETRLAVK
jgi:hypothetical protein